MGQIKLLSWNVNGLRAVTNKGAFRPVFSLGADVLCFQETRVTEEQLQEDVRSIEGYSSFFVSAEKKGYSGVAIYTRITPIDVKKGFGNPKFDNEGRTLIADFGEFVLFNIYYPNGGASDERLKYKMEFYDYFLDYVDALKRSGRKIVICGDVNTAHREIDLANPKSNEKTSGFLPEERAWVDKFVDRGFIDTFRLFNQEGGNYTWWDSRTFSRKKNVGWRIDYFFVSESLRQQVVAAEILSDVMGSDHCPVTLTLSIPD